MSQADLARDAMEARKLGLTYGEYRARRDAGLIPDPEKSVTVKVRRVCAVCGQPFVGKQRDQRYCSRNCQWEAANRRKSERAKNPDKPKNATANLPPRKCLYCGKEIANAMRASRKYCDAICSRRYRRKKFAAERREAELDDLFF